MTGHYNILSYHIILCRAFKSTADFGLFGGKMLNDIAITVKTLTVIIGDDFCKQDLFSL